MKILSLLLLALIAAGTNASASWPSSEDSDCLEWAYVPPQQFLEEFHGPKFEGSQFLMSGQPAASAQPQFPEEFFGPKFDEGQIELIEPHTTQSPHQMPLEFLGPKFEDSQIVMLDTTAQPQFPEEFFGPKFDEGQIELLEPRVTQSPQQLPVEFYGPKFEDSQLVMLDTTAQPQSPEEFFGPKFEEGQIELIELHTTQPPQQLPKETYYGLEIVEKPVIMPQAPSMPPQTTTRYPAKTYFVRDDFASDRLGKTAVVEQVDGPSHTVEVHDEFVVKPKEERPKKVYYPRHERYMKKVEPKKVESVKYHHPISQKAVVRDGFVNDHLQKIVVEPADVPSHVEKVHDEFVAEPKKPKAESPKKEQSSFERLFGTPFYDFSPVTQIFLDMVKAEAPVHDSFSSGVSEKTEIEPIHSLPESKVDVHDQFTFSDDEKAAYRMKRSANADSKPTDDGFWKLVCVKRRPKPKARVLTAVDFIDAHVELNERISRCVGRLEGEHVAAGLCRKYYLRCTAPTISVLMCSHMGEVFSEAMKQCVPKIGLGECDISRTVRSRMISFTPEKSADKPKEPVVVETNIIQGDFNEFCLDRADGFYRDSKNCSRVLQCFDNDLFEYPPCSEPLVFDVRRGVCDYREKVPACTNN